MPNAYNVFQRTGSAWPATRRQRAQHGPLLVYFFHLAADTACPESIQQTINQMTLCIVFNAVNLLIKLASYQAAFKMPTLTMLKFLPPTSA